MVTYGAMSKKPLTVGAGSLIFDNQWLCGFWLTDWVANNSPAQRMDMINHLLVCYAVLFLSVFSLSCWLGLGVVLLLLPVLMAVFFRFFFFRFRPDDD